MAYRDMNGRITIDEYAANADIRKEQEAEAILREAANKLTQLQREAEQYKGAMIEAIVEKSAAQARTVHSLMWDLQNVQNVTRNTVRKYKILDQECKKRLLQK